MPKTDGARVVADLRRLAEFGRYKTGVHRPTYSPEDVASRQWLAEKFAEAGLDPVIDGIGNVFGRNRRAARALLVGSHSETQPHGGWLDGALGVIYGLEAGARLAADPDRSTGSASRPSPGPTRKGITATCSAAAPSPARSSDDEIARATSRDGKTLCATRSPRPGMPGSRAIACEPAALSRLFRGAYRAGRHARGDRQAHRHRRGDRRHLELLGHCHRRAEPCRHDRRCTRRKDAAVAMVRLAARIHDRFAEIAGELRARCGRSAAS